MVVDGQTQVRLHYCEGRSPSLVLAQIRRIKFAGTSLRSLATWPKRPSLRLRTMYETSNRPVRCKTSSLDTKSCQLICRMRHWLSVPANYQLKILLPVFVWAAKFPDVTPSKAGSLKVNLWDCWNRISTGQKSFPAVQITAGK